DQLIEREAMAILLFSASGRSGRLLQPPLLALVGLAALGLLYLPVHPGGDLILQNLLDDLVLQLAAFGNQAGLFIDLEKFLEYIPERRIRILRQGGVLFPVLLTFRDDDRLFHRRGREFPALLADGERMLKA